MLTSIWFCFKNAPASAKRRWDNEMQSLLLQPDASVLLVEDDDMIRDCLAELLADIGWRVTAAADADQALRIADTHMIPDVLVVQGHSGICSTRVGSSLSA